MKTDGLEAAVTRWRQEFRANPAFSGECLAELEAHLLEATELAARDGHDPVPAFEHAAERLGTPETLAHDYLATSGLGRRTLALIEDHAMKYLLPASIVFASVLVAFTFGKPDQTGPLYQISTDQSGTWRLNTRTGELCRISGTMDFAGNANYAERLELDGCMISPELAADPETARLTGRVMLSGGEIPAVGARVFLGSGAGTTTDKMGRFEFASREDGSLNLTVSLFEATTTQEVVLDKGTHTTIDLELPDASEGGYSVGGVVLDAQGLAISGAGVTVNQVRTTIDESGRFEVPVRGPGVYQVRIYAEDGSLFSTARVTRPGLTSETYRVPGE